MQYSIKCSKDLSDKEIELILKSWEIEDWFNLNSFDFKIKFENSEFHFLEIEDKIVSLARINFNFRLEIQKNLYNFAEFVGFVSIEKAKKYGSFLFNKIVANLTERKIETIGFCKMNLRPFYEKNNIQILYGKGIFITEFENNEWIDSDDDDILILSTSEEHINILQNLNEQNKAILI
ncbi:hypothetical protein ACFOWU_08530 [Epilithonimonas zeae]|uniref:GNAT family N-acetyltransferase n=1 Tax=Epilithonimonas zeae TaxID=1416779 RepID=A0A1N6GD56_9FLAO|nr:hypothetical protein [Epilithonimonas zeae]SIO05460.1 hypothetical protein SAMN05444409_1780 [Epilithonimonas zeae]